MRNWGLTPSFLLKKTCIYLFPSSHLGGWTTIPPLLLSSSKRLTNRRQRGGLQCWGSNVSTRVESSPAHRHPTLWKWCSCTQSPSPRWNRSLELSSRFRSVSVCTGWSFYLNDIIEAFRGTMCRFFETRSFLMCKAENFFQIIFNHGHDTKDNTSVWVSKTTWLKLRTQFLEISGRPCGNRSRILSSVKTFQITTSIAITCVKTRKKIRKKDA